LTQKVYNYSLKK